MEFWQFGLWGAAGAFVYAVNALILQLWNEGATPKGKTKAIAEFFAALATGTVAAAGLSGVITKLLEAGIVIGGATLRMSPDQIAVALTVGWSSNYLWPRVLRKLGQKVDGIGGSI